MASTPSARRFLLTGALNTGPYVRTSRTGTPAAVASSLRATFSCKSGITSRAATRAVTRAPQPQLPRRQGHVPISGVRWSTTSATGSKIWTFEEIQSLSSSSSSPSTDPKVTLIDVREPSELKSTGRIPGAVNIPITTSPDSFHLTPEEFEDRFGFARPGPDDEVVFYCKAGVRSRAAAGIAREAGWRHVGEYPGSWIEWSGKGGAVER
ncbi:Rhodanese-like domain-containing protein [Xylariaceae sp. FL1651]|nr:Rhodanese-like domain-containing protein [Xylariaceae sp. FL1651]